MARPDRSPAPKSAVPKKNHSDHSQRTADGRSLTTCTTEEYSRLLRNPGGVMNVPQRRKASKMARGPSEGTAAGDGPKTRRHHKDVIRARLGPRRQAVRRQELDLSWFQESNPSRVMSRSTRDQLVRELMDARAGRPVSVGPKAAAWLAREARSLPGMLPERLLVSYLRVKAFDALVQVTERKVQPARKASRVPAPVIAPNRRGAVAAVIEATLKAAENWSPVARERLRKRLLDEFGIRVSV